MGAIECKEQLRWAEAWVQAILSGVERKRASVMCLRQGWGMMGQAESIYGGPITLKGRVFDRGLGTHADSEIVVTLDSPGETLHAVVGVDDNPDTRSHPIARNIFIVEADGAELWRSRPLQVDDEPVDTAVALRGAKTFTLKVQAEGGSVSYAHADWADARVRLADGEVVYLGRSVAELGLPTESPFSFIYGGQTSGELLRQWIRSDQTEAILPEVVLHRVTWQDPASGLKVRLELKRYLDFPAIEWVVYFKNISDNETPILSDVHATDVRVRRDGTTEFVLHSTTGDTCSREAFKPTHTPLRINGHHRVAPTGGRSTNGAWPYFNIDWGGRGAILAVGWPGQWAASFQRDDTRYLRVIAGQEVLRTKLLPHEEIRTPLTVLLFWQGGDWIDGQNLWRRWMQAHSMPRLENGQIPQPMLLGCSSRLYSEMTQATTQNQIMCIDRYRQERIPLDYWWMDAGWYICPDDKGNPSWWVAGTWEVDPKRFPKGLREISDHAHAHGIKILVWFEPERVHARGQLAGDHRDWVLGNDAELAGGSGILNIGNPDALRWITDHVANLLNEQGIDLYRQDFNTDPLERWQRNDAPDRQGITELKHIVGHLAYYDELRLRNRNMLIDTCASGGRRMDIETLRRAAPLWRTDHAYDATSNQAMTYGLSFWAPFSGTGMVGCKDPGYMGSGKTPMTPYYFWSTATPSMVLTFDIREDLDYDMLRKLVADWKSVWQNVYGDFYPLLDAVTSDSVWQAWQFHRPRQGQGVVQVFRRQGSPYLSARLPLRGLEAQATYHFTELNSGLTNEYAGEALMNSGLHVILEERPEAAVFTYRRL